MDDINLRARLAAIRNLIDALDEDEANQHRPAAAEEQAAPVQPAEEPDGDEPMADEDMEKLKAHLG